MNEKNEAMLDDFLESLILLCETVVSLMAPASFSWGFLLLATDINFKRCSPRREKEKTQKNFREWGFRHRAG